MGGMTDGVRALLLAACLVGGIATPAGADPHDSRRCVSAPELWHTPAGLTRVELERRWEVRGKGEYAVDPVFGRGWFYPMCGPRTAYADFKPGYGLVGVGDVLPNN